MLRSFAFCLAALLTTSALAERPNIVFILADDLGWSDVGFHGGQAPTPHLDRLVREGVELAQHYVAPVCSPTRTALHTGRFWSRFGVTSPQSARALAWDTITLPRALKSAGYDTCITGKWHLGSKPEWGPLNFGYDHSYGSLGGGVGPWNHRYKEGPYSRTWHRDDVLVEEPGHVTDLIAAEAARWITARGDAPFFLYVPFTAVHLPLKEPPAWLDRVPGTITGEVPRHYAASVMHLDDGVGKILAALDQAGKRGNTLVIFSSDNGGSTAENCDLKYPADDYPQGSLTGNNLPLRGGKATLYEGGIRVPTVACWPGKLRPGKVPAACHVVDWMPTLCGVAQCESVAGQKFDGTNIWPLLQEPGASLDRPLYWTGPNFRASAVRQGDWKLITYRGDKAKTELFDLSQDPYETQNLAAARPERVAALEALMAQIAKDDNDSVVPSDEGPAPKD